jgi:hypothetical protein
MILEANDPRWPFKTIINRFGGCLLLGWGLRSIKEKIVILAFFLRADQSQQVS